MKVSMMALSRTGKETGEKLKAALEAAGMDVCLDTKSKYIPDSTILTLDEWTAKEFAQADVLIWICACGIAVRHIAPYVKSKRTDPAVIVVDECGKFAISLLSGHLGGANELTLKVAEILASVPVVTTATDLHKCFAVDVFSKKNCCEIRNMTAAKDVSAALLDGKKVGFYSEFPWEGKLPDGLIPCNREGFPLEEEQNNSEELHTGISITIHRGVRPFQSTVTIIPKTVVLGMGCRRGKEEMEIAEAARNALLKANIYQDAVEKIVSIDLKKEEAGLHSLAESWNIAFETYTEEELRSAEGEFSVSDFVRSVTGVDNVCERSAVFGSGNGQLIQKKEGKNGVTTAIAIKNRRMYFE